MENQPPIRSSGDGARSQGRNDKNKNRQRLKITIQHNCTCICLSFPEVAPGIYFILSGYAKAEPVPETSKLVSFRQLPGGAAYHKAFLGRVVLSIQRVFGSKPRMLVEAAKLLGGSEANYGDCSVKVYSLPLVPITVILWGESPEFPASANMLFDASISHY